MSGRLAGKVAIITGGASGMGAADARLFVAEGASVVITDLNEAAGQALAAELGDHARFIKHNVTDEAEWGAVVEETKRAFGRIDVLVNNAGILMMKPIEETSQADFEKIMSVNVTSVYLGIRAVSPTMKEQGKGSIVNMSSLAGMSGQAGAIAYTTSKWAVRGMTKTAAIDLGPFGVRVNSIHPGAIATPMTGANPDDPMPLAPLNHAGRAEEVSQAVLFLAADKSSYVSGAELAVDGAMGAGVSGQIYGILHQLAAANS